jgi:hypothetical protein
VRVLDGGKMVLDKIHMGGRVMVYSGGVLVPKDSLVRRPLRLSCCHPLVMFSRCMAVCVRDVTADPAWLSRPCTPWLAVPAQVETNLGSSGLALPKSYQVGIKPSVSILELIHID